MAQPNFSVTYTVKEKGKKAPKYDVENDINGEATLENLLLFTKNSLIKISDAVLAEEQANGFDKKPTLLVDGKFNRRKEDVSPLGKIQYVARSDVRELILYAYEMIRVRTKVVTGNYERNNVVFYNSVPVARTRGELERWLENNKDFSPKDIIRFINLAPYARKLERYGISKGRTTEKRRAPKKHEKRKSTARIQVPNGTYALAYRAIERKYKANSFIKFELLRGEFLGLTGPGRVYKKGPTPGRAYLYPSIVISLVESGLNDLSTNRTIQ